MKTDQEIKNVLAASDVARFAWGSELDCWTKWKQCFDNRSTANVADACNVSRSRVQMIRRIGAHGGVELLHRVSAGELGVRMAADAISFNCSDTFYPGIYYVDCGGRIKIGSSPKNPTLRAYRVGCATENGNDWDELYAYPVQWTDAYAAEQLLHAEFSQYRIPRKSRGGTEWYTGINLDALRETMAEAADGAPVIRHNC